MGAGWGQHSPKTHGQLMGFSAGIKQAVGLGLLCLQSADVEVTQNLVFALVLLRLRRVTRCCDR